MVDLVAGPTTGGIILAFETARQLGVRPIFAEEVRDDGGHPRPRVPARVPDRARRAGPPRRRHPDHRRLAARDAPGHRGDGRRDRRMRRPRRPQRGWRPSRRRRRAVSTAPPCGSSTCRPTSRAGDLPALCRRDGALCTGQHRHGGRAAGADLEPVDRRRGIFRAAFVVVGRRGCGRRPRRDATADPPRRGPTRRRRRASSSHVDSTSLGDVTRGSRSGRPTGRTSTSSSGSSRTRRDPPGHLAEHQATAQPVRLVPDGRFAAGGDPDRGRPGLASQPPARMTGRTSPRALPAR